MIIYDVKADANGETRTLATFFQEKQAQHYIDLLRDARCPSEMWIDEKKLFHSAWEAMTED